MWYVLLMYILYLMCGAIVLPLLMLLFLDFDYFFLAVFEIYTVIFFIMVNGMGSSYERSGSATYLLFFGYVLSFGVVMNNSLGVIGLLLLVLGLAKLPMYSLHAWLPNVHVEASIVSSMVLASGVLNLGILYMWNFGWVMIVSVVLLISSIVIVIVLDSNGFAAYSSVLHMTLCAVFSLYVILLVSYMHIIVSPLMFITVYISYIYSGGRFYLNSGVVMIILWMINFSVPFLSSFFSEVYVMSYNGVILLVVILMYLVTGVVLINSVNMDGNGLIYVPVMVLYIIIM